MKQNMTKFSLNRMSDPVKFVMCSLVSRVHMTLYILTKGYTVPGNQDTLDKLNRIYNFLGQPHIMSDQYLKISDSWMAFVVERSV